MNMNRNSIRASREELAESTRWVLVAHMELGGLATWTGSGTENKNGADPPDHDVEKRV
jgi:hypothetical protein